MAEFAITYTDMDTKEVTKRFAESQYESWCDALPAIIAYNREYAQKNGDLIREEKRGYLETGEPYLDTLFVISEGPDIRCRMVFHRTVRIKAKVDWYPRSDPATDTVVFSEVFGNWNDLAGYALSMAQEMAAEMRAVIVAENIPSERKLTLDFRLPAQIEIAPDKRVRRFVHVVTAVPENEPSNDEAVVQILEQRERSTRAPIVGAPMPPLDWERMTRN